MDLSPVDRTLIEQIQTLSSQLDPVPTGVEACCAPMEGIRAILFDVYGTLFISGTGDIGIASQAGAREEAMEAALTAAGFELVGEEIGSTSVALFVDIIEAHHEQRRAEGVESPEVEIREVWRELLLQLATRGLVQNPSRLSVRRKAAAPNAPGWSETVLRAAVEYECRSNPVWSMPELETVIDAMQAADLRMGIVSNAQFYTPLLFCAFLGQTPEQLFLEDSLSVWSYLLREAKPSTKLYETAAGQLRAVYGIEPSEALYVGNDMRNDIWPASLAGFRTCLYAGDKRSLRLREDDARVAGVTPDRTITALGQLIPIVA